MGIRGRSRLGGGRADERGVWTCRPSRTPRKPRAVSGGEPAVSECPSRRPPGQPPADGVSIVSPTTARGVARVVAVEAAAAVSASSRVKGGGRTSRGTFEGGAAPSGMFA